MLCQRIVLVCREPQNKCSLVPLYLRTGREIHGQFSQNVTTRTKTIRRVKPNGGLLEKVCIFDLGRLLVVGGGVDCPF